MKYCSSCNIFLNDEKEKCSLCDKVATNKIKKSNKQEYPKLINRSKLNKRLDETIFGICVLLNIIFIILNFITYDAYSFSWSILTFVLSTIFYLFLKFSFFSVKSISIKLFFIQSVITTIFMVLDITTSVEVLKYWSFTYVVPFLGASFMIVTLSILMARKGAYQDYFGNILLNIIILLTPITVYFVYPNLITSVYPSIFSTVISILSFILIVVIPSKSTKEEIKKRIHI